MEFWLPLILFSATSILFMEHHQAAANCMISIETIVKRLQSIGNLSNNFEFAYFSLNRPNLYVGQILNEIWSNAFNIQNTCYVMPNLPYNITQIIDGKIIVENESSQINLTIDDRQIKWKICSGKNSTMCQRFLISNGSDDIPKTSAVIHSGMRANSKITRDLRGAENTTDRLSDLGDLVMQCEVISIRKRSTFFEASNCTVVNNEWSTPNDIFVASLKINII